MALAASVGLALAADRWPWFSELAPALFVLAWVGPAWLLAERRGLDPLRAHGVLVRPAGLGLAALVTLLLFAGFVGAVALVGAPVSPSPAPAALGREGLTALVWGGLFVALPEEWLYRGVLQPALDGPPRGRLLGAEVGRGLVLAALLFGLAHGLYDLAVHREVTTWRLLTAVPALLFGWLRARTGSVLVAASAHALADALERVVRAVWTF